MKVLYILIIVIISAIAFEANMTYPSYGAELNAKMDKMYYNNTDTAHVIISGSPSTPVSLAVVDSSSQQKLATVVHLDPNGTGTFSFNLTSFNYGIYTTMVGQGHASVKISFGVGLLPSGIQINMKVIKSNFIPGELIRISGLGQSNSMINVTLKDLYGTIENSTDVLTDYSGNFMTTLQVPHNAINGVWKLDAKSGTNHESLDIMINSPYDNNSTSENNLTIANQIFSLSPLKQFKSGISAKDVKCENNLQLVLKAENSFPVCVKPSSAQKLVTLGWAKLLNS
ncbi:MAG: hypothetical protein HY222_03100 [Thaumarchaeota archaeon]|nr:hypothetical protein [Nitrososphaerota archaeon]MBI3641362.1 hypothetical protein [Nitrososphaerota archaeon]